MIEYWLLMNVDFRWFISDGFDRGVMMYGLRLIIGSWFLMIGHGWVVAVFLYSGFYRQVCHQCHNRICEYHNISGSFVPLIV